MLNWLTKVLCGDCHWVLNGCAKIRMVSGKFSCPRTDVRWKYVWEELLWTWCLSCWSKVLANAWDIVIRRCLYWDIFTELWKTIEAELLTQKIFILIFIYFFILFQGCIGVVSKLFVGDADDASSPCCSIPFLPPKMVVIVDFRVNDVSCHTYCIHF